MIEHKYRAWDMSTDPNGKMIPWVNLKEFPGKIIFINAPREVILMQFTGQKDNKKKDIYAEDILKGTMAYGAGMTQKKGKECLFVVKTYLGEWGYCFHLKQITKLPSNYRALPSFDECEVVGNTFLNPELL